MAKKNIGVTLSIKDSGFITSIKNAATGTKDLKKHTTNATGSIKKMGKQTGSTATFSSDRLPFLGLSFPCILIQTPSASSKSIFVSLLPIICPRAARAALLSSSSVSFSPSDCIRSHTLP